MYSQNIESEKRGKECSNSLSKTQFFFLLMNNSSSSLMGYCRLATDFFSLKNSNPVLEYKISSKVKQICAKVTRAFRRLSNPSLSHQYRIQNTATPQNSLPCTQLLALSYLTISSERLCLQYCGAYILR